MRLALWGALLIGSGGCQLLGLGKKPEGDPPEPSPEPVIATAYALEYDSDGVEMVDVRSRTKNGIQFDYVASADLAAKLAADAPERVILIAHGWMNDTRSAREFTSKLARGILIRAGRSGVPADELRFVGIHWDSESINFYGSAETAETIGRRRVSPLLAQIAEAVPGARVVMVGHSLGARLTLASIQGRGGEGRALGGAVLLEGAVDESALLPGSDPESFGKFPLAPGRTAYLVNVHSKNDSVLEETYARAMQSPALGLAGALREGELRYAMTTLQGSLDVKMLEGALNQAGAVVPGASARLLNVDGSANISGHSDIFNDAVFDVIWSVSSLSPPAQGS